VVLPSHQKLWLYILVATASFLQREATDQGQVGIKVGEALRKLELWICDLFI
jgi:hypothetical protein